MKVNARCLYDPAMSDVPVGGPGIDRDPDGRGVEDVALPGSSRDGKTSAQRERREGFDKGPHSGLSAPPVTVDQLDLVPDLQQDITVDSGSSQLIYFVVNSRKGRPAERGLAASLPSHQDPFRFRSSEIKACSFSGNSLVLARNPGRGRGAERRETERDESELHGRIVRARLRHLRGERRLQRGAGRLPTLLTRLLLPSVLERAERSRLRRAGGRDPRLPTKGSPRARRTVTTECELIPSWRGDLSVTCCRLVLNR